MSDKILSIHTDDAPKAVGPYSQAVQSGGFIFMSGQLGIDPKIQQMVTGNSERQLVQIFENIKNILSSSGSSMSNVVKVTVFLKNIQDFKQVNEVYATFFRPPFPARSAVEVSSLPLGADIMLDVIALRQQ